jgi:hypothetical protein
LLTSLTLLARPVTASNPSFFGPEGFVVASLAVNGAATFNQGNAILQVGTVTSVPEPASSIPALTAGVAGLAYILRRRRPPAPR